MSENSPLDYLKQIYHDRKPRQHGKQLRQVLMAVALPVTAGWATACYGVPMEDYLDDPLPENYRCTVGTADPGQELYSCDDWVCAESELCLGNCSDGEDNDGNGLADCSDLSCAEDPGCTR